MSQAWSHYQRHPGMNSFNRNVLFSIYYSVKKYKMVTLKKAGLHKEVFFNDEH